jgi:outer membrane protein assembly factor BamB
VAHGWRMAGLLAAALAWNGAVSDAGAPAAGSGSSDDSMVAQLGVTRGLVAVVGDQNADRAIRLAGRFQVYLQLAPSASREAARQAADAAGFLGPRIQIDAGPTDRIGLADNLADAVIVIPPSAVSHQPSAISGPERDPNSKIANPRPTEAEALRVVRPGGRVLLGDRATTKPMPTGVDDWSHPFHGPDNNPFSADRRVQGPFLTQFMSGPRMAPVPQLTVASSGRVFKLYGHLGLRTPGHPYVNKLVAYNGYNGLVLWERTLKAGFMTARQTLAATPEAVYLGDDESCKVLDPATGAVKRDLTLPAGVADGPVWKWLAVEGNVLYGLLGPVEAAAPEVRTLSDRGGWGWPETGPGFMKPEAEFPWLFGRTLVAIDLATGAPHWTHQEQDAVDGRGVGLAAGRLVFFRFGKFLACLDAATGKELWRRTPENSAEVFRAVGDYKAGANSGSVAGGGFPIAPYLICTDRTVALTGLPLNTLTVVSSDDGRLLYNRKYTGHLVIDADVVYAIGYGSTADYGSWKFDLMSGQALTPRTFAGGLSCARPTGCPGGIFYRGYEGTVQFEPESRQVRYLAAMRPSCTDGVTIANGQLYWWPWLCGCPFSLSGVISLAPAGDFMFGREATEAGRLTIVDARTRVAELSESPADWSSVRAESMSAPRVAPGAAAAWEFDAAVPPEVALTAPVTAGGLVFFGGGNGAVWCLDGETGRLKWKAYTGGPVRVPPTVWQGRCYTGSGDGRVYCHEGATGRLLWRFQAAPADRRLFLHGWLSSTWPVNSGVAVADGVCYFAAGIACHDGTHVYALDAITGRIKWQNNTSGHLDAALRVGVSAQGMVLVHEGKAYLAGGTVASPAAYDAATGQCLNEPLGKYQPGRLNTRGAGGWALAVDAQGKIKVSGAKFYTPDGPFFSPFSAQAVVGHALDRQGRTILVRRDGHVLCLATKGGGA